jgi:hypothetical protein
VESPEDTRRPRHAARFVVENEQQGHARVRCAGLDIVAVGTGLVGVDPATGRWAWLLVRPTYFTAELERLACIDNLVFGYGPSIEYPVVTVIEPHSGGWQITASGKFEAPRPTVSDWGNGERTFRGTTLHDLARSLAGASIDESPAADAPTHDTECAGWRLSWSRGEVVARRGDDEQSVEHADYDHRIVGVRCTGTRAVITETTGVDVLAPAPAVIGRVIYDFSIGAAVESGLAPQ